MSVKPRLVISLSLHVLSGLLWVYLGLDSDDDGTKVLFSSVGVSTLSDANPLRNFLFLRGPDAAQLQILSASHPDTEDSVPAKNSKRKRQRRFPKE